MIRIGGRSAHLVLRRDGAVADIVRADYTSATGSGGGGGPSLASSDGDGLSVAELRQQYTDYLGAKTAEIEEQRVHRHYYHGDQLDAATLQELRRRGQPATIRDKASRKINGVVGLVERLRQDPKAFPRTPKHEDGAELATSSIRYVMDNNNWQALSANEARDGSVNGIFGVEMGLKGGDAGDPDVTLDEIDNDTFFYDPRSFRYDFSDARFMGVAKWLDLDVAKEMFPDRAEDLAALVSRTGGAETWQQQDRELKWVDSKAKRVFLVEHWYQQGSEWRFCFYVADTMLRRGKSPFTDEDGKTISRYVVGSVNVDHDGDRYGFLRLLKTLIDELNALVSKRAHLINMRRIIAEVGAVENVDTARKEAVRADGYLEVNPNKRFEFDDQSRIANIAHINEAIQEVKDEIENFGPNPALIGQGIENKSGRAIALLQQAGIAELGPFILSYRDWKIRVYRAVWCAIRKHWTAERWIRVTDEEGNPQFQAINVLQLDEMGQPYIANALGQLDVDVILDEGPDTINMMQDTYDTLTALAQSGQTIPPQVLIELSPIPASTKRKILGILEEAQQPNPIQVEGARVKIEREKAGAAKDMAAAKKTIAGIPGEQARAKRDNAGALRDVVGAATDLHAARQPRMPPDGARPSDGGLGQFGP